MYYYEIERSYSQSSDYMSSLPLEWKHESYEVSAEKKELLDFIKEYEWKYRMTPINKRVLLMKLDAARSEMLKYEKLLGVTENEK